MPLLSSTVFNFLLYTYAPVLAHAKLEPWDTKKARTFWELSFWPGRLYLPSHSISTASHLIKVDRLKWDLKLRLRSIGPSRDLWLSPHSR